MTDKATMADLGSTTGLGAWVQTAERLPDMDLPVWLYENGFVFIGCRGDCGEGWLWAQCYVVPSFNAQGAWQSVGAEADDDYQPTLWQPLPEPPRYTQAALDAAKTEAAELAAGLRVE